MKRHILTLGLLVFTAYNSFGQITINLKDQTPDISGQTVNISNVTGEEDIIELIVHNNTGSSLNWKITRSRIDVPSSGWTDFLCWGSESDLTGGTCYPASLMPGNSWVTPQALTINNSNAGALDVHINPDNLISGSGHYRYYIGQDSDLKMDSVDIIVTTSTLSIKETKQSSIGLYPNPADNLITISLPNGSEGNVKLTDVLGKTIYDERLNSTKKVDISTFKNGVYVATVTVNGVNHTKRFVVKH